MAMAWAELHPMGALGPITSCQGDIGDIAAMGTSRPTTSCRGDIGDITATGTSWPWGCHGQELRPTGTPWLWGHHGQELCSMGTPWPTTSCHGDIGDIMAMGTPRPRALCYDGDTAPPWGRHGHGDVTARSSALWGHCGQQPRAMGTSGAWGHRGQERCAMGMGTSVPHHGDTSGPRPPSHSHRVTAMGTSEGRNPTTYHGGQQDHDPNATGTAGP